MVVALAGRGRLRRAGRRLGHDHAGARGLGGFARDRSPRASRSARTPRKRRSRDDRRRRRTAQGTARNPFTPLPGTEGRGRHHGEQTVLVRLLERRPHRALARRPGRARPRAAPANPAPHRPTPAKPKTVYHVAVLFGAIPRPATAPVTPADPIREPQAAHAAAVGATAAGRLPRRDRRRQERDLHARRRSDPARRRDVPAERVAVRAIDLTPGTVRAARIPDAGRRRRSSTNCAS